MDPTVDTQTIEQNDGTEAVDESPDYGDNNENLPEPLQIALRQLLKTFAGQEKFARRNEVMEARRQRFYWRNDQYIYWNAAAWVFAPVTNGVSVNVGSESVDMPRYTDVYNIYQPYGRSLISVLAQNPPGVNFEPDDPMNSADITAAKNAEKFRHVVDRANDRKKLQGDIARLFWTDGRVILYTRSVKDAQKFGLDDQGQPNSAEIITAFGVLESKVPIVTKDISEWTYAVLSDEVDINMGKLDYPDAADKMKEGISASGESAYERMARLGVLQGTRIPMQAGDALQHLVTRHRVWFRPAAFEKVAQDLSTAEDVKQQLKDLFPDGCFAVFTGDAYCEARNESMDDSLTVGHALPGDGQNRPSLGKSLVPIQDAFNDLMNLRKETYDYCIPTTWMDQELGDIDALREQISEPGNHVPGLRPTGMAMQDAFYTEAPATCPPDMIEAMESLQGPLSQFITGALPSLFGGNMEDQKTAAAYSMARDQAMGQLGLPWGSMQEMYASAYKQAVICAARNRAADQQLHVDIPGASGKATTEIINVSDLQKGNFHTFPDNDSSFPETTAAKRQAYMSLMAQAGLNPFLMDTMTQPDNLELGKEMIGLGDLVIPGAEARNKQLREIEQLLNEAPVPPSQEEMMQFAQGMEQFAAQSQIGAATGLPAPPPPQMPQPKSSVPVDPIFDLHKFEFEEVQRWLNSEERVEQDNAGNQLGVQNVRLHGIEHFQIMQAQQAPPMPPPMPAKHGAPAPAAQPAPAAPAPPLM